MNYNPDKHHRRSIRLKSYDYRQSGAYFVTIVAQDRACLFGDVVNEETRLNDAGGIIEHWWFELNHKFPTVETDKFVVMPNHFHGIIVIADVTVGADLRVGPVTDLRVGPVPHVGPDSEGAHTGAPLPTTRMGTGVNPDAHPTHQGAHTGAPLHAPVFAPGHASLPTVVQWFKTMTTNEYMRGIKTLGWTPFRGRLWQRNYYEHIVRDDVSLNRIRQYILDNPARWEFDRENPAATAPDLEDAWCA